MASSAQSYFASRTSGLNAVFGTFTSSKSYSTTSDLIAPDRNALVFGYSPIIVNSLVLSGILLSSLVLKRRIKRQRGLPEYPITILRRQEAERVAGERDEFRQRLPGGREVRAPGDAVGAEFLHQPGEERLRRGAAVARLLEIAMRHLEMDVGIAREREQRRGRRIGRAVRHLGARQVIDDEAHLWEPLQHRRELREAPGAHLHADRQARLAREGPGRKGLRVGEPDRLLGQAGPCRVEP